MVTIFEMDTVLLAQISAVVIIVFALMIYMWYELIGWTDFKFESSGAIASQTNPSWVGKVIVFRNCIFKVVVGDKEYSADVTNNLNAMAYQCRVDSINPMTLVSVYIPSNGEPCPTGSIPAKNAGAGCWTQQGALHPFAFYIPDLPLTDSFSSDTQNAVSMLYGSYRVFST